MGWDAEIYTIAAEAHQRDGIPHTDRYEVGESMIA